MSDRSPAPAAAPSSLPSAMRLGVLTGGEDVPGLNPCIKACVARADGAGHEVVGIRRGWAGLLEFNPDDPDTVEPNVQRLDPATVRTIDRTGGTVLHTSRTNPANVRGRASQRFSRMASAVMARSTSPITSCA